MAEKTTTLKTKTNDNVYPNIIGDNRKNAFVDSSTITHHFYDKTHKVGFQIANETNIKIQNSLQKPAGLTKTKLVGVGTNGQENIEIGDNLTLANGKLSATGGGGESNVNVLEFDINQEHFTGDIDFNKVNIIKNGSNDKSIITSTVDLGRGKLGSLLVPNLTDEGYPDGGILVYTLVKSGDYTAIVRTLLHARYFSHFITLTNNTSTFYLNYQNTSEYKLNTLGSLKTALAGKALLCTGHTDSDTAEYISGEGGNIVVGVVDNSDKSTSGINIDSSFTITDEVSPVE